MSAETIKEPQLENATDEQNEEMIFGEPESEKRIFGLFASKLNLKPPANNQSTQIAKPQ